MANAATTDAASSYFEHATSPDYDLASSFNHSCTLIEENTKQLPTERDLADLRMLGIGADALSVNIYNVANVMGVRFRAGEWGKRPRCGSVFTCVVNGKSVYGHVLRFMTVEGNSSPGFAAVKWLGVPVYPFRNPLVVRVGADGSDTDGVVGSIIPITKIDPSRVAVEVVDRNRFYVIRFSGYDTRPGDTTPAQ